MAGVLWAVSAAWKLGRSDWDPFDRFRDRAAVRDDVPAQSDDAIDCGTLDQPREEGKLPANLFVYGIAYFAGVPIFGLVSVV